MRDSEEIAKECREELNRLWKHYDEANKAHLREEAKATLGKIVGIEWTLDKVLDYGY